MVWVGRCGCIGLGGEEGAERMGRMRVVDESLWIIEVALPTP